MKLAALWLLAGARKLLNGPFAAGILTRGENGLLLVPPNDVMVGRRLSFNGSYDSGLLDCILALCPPASEILFVGAHVGALAIPVAGRVKRVVAIEANPTIFELLRMNVVLNGLENVEIQNFAAGDRNGEVCFLAGGMNSGGSRIEMGERDSWADSCDRPVRLTVPMKRLDDVFPEASFDLIIMDIEGSEVLALRGMGALVARSRGLLVEVFEHHLRHVAKVTNEEFLSSVGPYFEEAYVLPEKPRPGEAASVGPYGRNAFTDMLQECCRRKTSNVLFLRDRSPSPFHS